MAKKFIQYAANIGVIIKYALIKIHHFKKIVKHYQKLLQ